jgi:hypothetical protein
MLHHPVHSIPRANFYPTPMIVPIWFPFVAISTFLGASMLKSGSTLDISLIASSQPWMGEKYNAAGHIRFVGALAGVGSGQFIFSSSTIRSQRTPLLIKDSRFDKGSPIVSVNHRANQLTSVYCSGFRWTRVCGYNMIRWVLVPVTKASPYDWLG